MRGLAFFVALFILSGCDRHYRIRINVCNTQDIPLENVHVLAESVNGELKLDIGQTDANGDIICAITGISELVFEFQKDGYRSTKQRFKLSNEELAKYGVILEDLESEDEVRDNFLPDYSSS